MREREGEIEKGRMRERGKKKDRKKEIKERIERHEKKPFHCKFYRKHRSMKYLPVDVRMGTTCKGNFETLCATLSSILKRFNGNTERKKRERNKI